MTAAGIALPLESRTVVSDENRLQKGIAVQTEIFGEQITRMHQTTPAERRSLMIDDLSGWCFGDFYTRKGLTIAERELATFARLRRSEAVRHSLVLMLRQIFAAGT